MIMPLYTWYSNYSANLICRLVFDDIFVPVLNCFPHSDFANLFFFLERKETKIKQCSLPLELKF